MPRTKKVKISQEEIDHRQVFALAKEFDLRHKLVYDLIDWRVITPHLETKEDISFLRKLGEVQRRRTFAKHILNRFAREEALTIATTALMSKTEIWVKSSIINSQKRGVIMTTVQLCADVYLLLRGGQVYSSEKPDHDLINLIRKVRKSIHNAAHYKVLSDNPCSPGNQEESRLLNREPGLHDELPFEVE